MKTRSDRHPRISVATTLEEFDACFASGAVFEASEELAAEMGFFPTTEDVISDEEFLSYLGSCAAGFLGVRIEDFHSPRHSYYLSLITCFLLLGGPGE